MLHRLSSPLLACLVGLSLFASASVAADPRPERLSICTWNLEWFFDAYTGDNSAEVARKESAPSREEWDWKVGVVADAVAKMKPTILCLQEIENRRVLLTLAKRLREGHGLDYKVAYVQGEDFFTEQDVGILYLSGMVEFGRRVSSEVQRADKSTYGLQKHLFARFAWGEGEAREELLLFNFHFRAMENADEIRRRQSTLLRQYLADHPALPKNVVLIGDTNTNQSYEETTPSGDTGILRGLNQDDPRLIYEDLHRFLAPEDRPTHIIGKQFDRIIVSPAMMSKEESSLVFRGVQTRKDLNTRGKEQDRDHWNIYWQIPQEERDVSDHFPLIAEFEFAR
jgi:endonuclease/exonuclease/phosphatase family metal-dependent hydrolase